MRRKERQICGTGSLAPNVRAVRSLAAQGAVAAVALLISGTLLGVQAANAVVVAPHALFIDHRTRSGVLYLQNSGDTAEEFSIRLVFGYPVSDSLGGIHVELHEEPPADAPSAAAWVRVLPARAVVQPGERQAVRLLAQPPPDLPDGEYWSRIIVESRAARPPVPVTVSDSDGVMVGLTLQMRTITSLTYRKGPLTTGIGARSFHAWIEGRELITDVRLEREGTAAFLGKLDLRLTDASGRSVGEWGQVLAVYRTIHRRLTYALSEDLGPGQYRLQLRISTDREDISPRDLLPVEAFERVIVLDLD